MTATQPDPGPIPHTASKEHTTMDVRKTLEDAAYITVGVGVIAFQQAQVRRREVQATFEKQAKDSRLKLESLAKDLSAKADAARSDVSGRVEPLVGDLRQRVEPIVEQLQSVPAQMKQAVEAGTSRARELVSRAA
jgi:gas vesicle protein